MPADNRKALVLRFPGAIRKPDESDPQRNPSTSADQASHKAESMESGQPEIPFAADMFRRCTQKKWSFDAWRDWLDWSRKLSNLQGGDFFGSERTIDSRYSVRFSDTKTLGETPGALHSDQAQAILEEFGLDDLVADFANFWEVVHACLMFPKLTPAALRRDVEIYGGALGLAGRLEEIKVLLRQKGLLR